METPAPARPRLVAYRCPACTAAQGADLVALSRGAPTRCTACGRSLSTTQVSRAIERTRLPEGAPSSTPGKRWHR